MTSLSKIVESVNVTTGEFTEFVNTNVATPPGNVVHAHGSPFTSSEWIVCEIIQLICFFIALYILYALVHFYTVQQSRRIYSGQSSGSRWLEKMCIFAVVCAIVRFANNQVLLFTWWESKTRCSVLLNVSIALYLISLCPVYLFLWLRQRIFYSNKALKHLYNRVIRFISWSTIFCFFVVTIVSMVLFVVDPTNNASGRVCRRTDEDARLSEHREVNVTAEGIRSAQEGSKKQGLKVNTIAGLLGGAIQTSFLALFLYPIMDNKLRTVRNLNVRCHHSLLRLIRRAFFLSGVCIATDIAIAFGVKGVYSLFPNAVFALIVMYDVNLIINIICIVTTFRRWRRMLFPWLYDCCGKSILSPYSKSDFQQHRQSNAGLNGSNIGSIRIKGSPIQETISLEIPKLTQLPVVDILLVSDGEEPDEKEKGYKKGNKRENGMMEGQEKKDFPKIETPKDERKWKTAGSRFADFLQFGHSRNTSRNPRIRRYTTGSTDQSIDDNGAKLISTAEVSYRSKQNKNVVTTKIIVKSESMILFEKTS